ncbi:unnamed protein product [Pleuronectes platessa]|uniref:Uncharacterized protein n=1 Tax=Pleuronectes platessa TaxID=8262 RepID=A0A9N7YPM7_PLEPL|nr:unnamed protein product [Pleuronectes platessa]
MLFTPETPKVLRGPPDRQAGERETGTGLDLHSSAFAILWSRVLRGWLKFSCRTSRRYEEFVELEGRGDFLERGELGAAPLTSGCGLDREGSWTESLSSLLPSAGWKKTEILGRPLLILAPMTSQVLDQSDQ